MQYRWLVGLAALLGSSAGAAAQDLTVSKPFWLPGGASAWTITLGADARMLPTYEGSSRYTVLPFPLFDIRRAGTPPNFKAPRDGFGFGIFESGSFRAGPAFKVRLPRRESADDALQGLGTVDFALEAGLFAEYWFAPGLRGRAELRQGFGGHHGLVGDLMADVVMPVTPQLTFSGGPRMTVMSTKALSPYFDVNSVQSAASGLPVFEASGGVYSYGAGAQARYRWSPQWETHVYLEYERLTGSAANSPITSLRGSRDQVQVGIGASYSFDVKAPW